MNKFAIYTACIGGYDNILKPEVTDERFDYFLFTNDVKEERVGVWQVRKVEYSNSDIFLSNGDIKPQIIQKINLYCSLNRHGR